MGGMRMDNFLSSFFLTLFSLGVLCNRRAHHLKLLGPPVDKATSISGCDFSAEVSPRRSNDIQPVNTNDKKLKEGHPVELKMTEADMKALGTDYAEGEVSRSDAERYPMIGRGSVRLSRHLYRTESEQREFLDKGLRVRLPGQDGYFEQRSGLLGLLRRLFTSLK
jgi:hypothetical protein